MSDDRRNFIGTAFGMRGAGKSFLLRRLLDKFPRVLTFDITTERVEQYPDAQPLYSVDEVLDALQDVAAVPRWHLIACIDQSDIPTIFRALAPKDMHTTLGYSRAIGGMCVEVPEIDTIAPVSGIAPEIRNAFQRGRHYKLSILGDTQRPHLVARIVSAMSDVLFCFQQHEPRDMKYLADVMSAPLAYRVRSLAKYEHLRYFPGRGMAQHVAADGSIVAAYRSDGELIP